MRRARVLLFVLLSFLAACRWAAQAYTSLDAHAFALRGQFNHDAGRVRIVILPAPN